MTCYLDALWAQQFDASGDGGDGVFGSWSTRGAAYGLPLFGGWMFPHDVDGVVLFRGATPASIDFDVPVGAAWPVGDVSTFPDFDQADGTQFYAGRTISPGGVLSKTWPAPVAVTVSGGVPVDPLPNAPYGIAVKRLAGGKFDLSWTHGPDDVAADFQVFAVSGASLPLGAIDYGSPIATVTYSRGKAVYTWTSGAYTHDDWVSFAVRARNAGGDAEQNASVTDPVQADAEGPPAHTTWSIECRA